MYSVIINMALGKIVPLASPLLICVIKTASAFDLREHALGVFLDLSKAFDMHGESCDPF